MFNPATPLDWLDHVLEQLDLVLMMSVNPGFGGQQFIDAALREDCGACAACSIAHGRPIRLEVDGGVKVENIGRVAAAGADTFVAGSAIFGSKDYQATIAAMRREIAWPLSRSPTALRATRRTRLRIAFCYARGRQNRGWRAF